MSIEHAIRRAQVYGFLADALLYPTENWTVDLLLLQEIMASLGVQAGELQRTGMELNELQAAHRRAFGLTGSLCYETECGLPHEYRQSQDMADIAGFYGAFGFQMGGEVRERPDHVAVELEFMHVLALKEALALENELEERAEICVQAQRMFLEDHLGNWIGLLAENLARQAGKGIYTDIVWTAEAFVRADAARLGAQPRVPELSRWRPTPFDPDFSCQDCRLADGVQAPSGGLA